MLSRSGWKIDKLRELEVFTPSILFSAQFHRAPSLPPISHGRENVSRIAFFVRPKLDYDRLARREKTKLFWRGKRAIGVSDVFAESKKGAVVREKVDRGLAFAMKLDLQLHRIGLEINQPAGGGVFRQWLGAAVQINDELGRSEEMVQIVLAHAKALVTFMERLIAP